MRTAETTDRMTVPIRVTGRLYRQVAKLAQDERRTIRAQFELFIEQALAQQPVLEVRKELRR